MDGRWVGALVVLGLLALTPALLAPAAERASAPPASAPLAPPDDEAPRLLALPEVDGGVGGANEPMILSDNGARGTHYLWIGALTSLWRSADHGATWQRLAPPTVPGALTDGYALAQDSAGALYVSNTQGQIIWVAKSDDGGSSWSQTTLSRFVTEADVIADRAWLATNGPDNVAVAMNSLLDGETCSYSTDGGATFMQRSEARHDKGSPNPGNILFDHAGRVTYATEQRVFAWNGPTPCTTTSLVLGAPTGLVLPASGSQIFTQLALDPATDKYYVAQPAPGNAAMEIRGFNGWNAATLKRLVVSPATVRSSTFGAIATRANGEIAVAWYGSTTAGDPAGTFGGSWNLYVARVTGFWTASPTVRVDQVTTSPMHQGGMCMSGVTCTSGRNLGDYMGVAYDAAGNVHVAFVNDATSSGTVFYAQLAAI